MRFESVATAYGADCSASSASAESDRPAARAARATVPAVAAGSVDERRRLSAADASRRSRHAERQASPAHERAALPGRPCRLETCVARLPSTGGTSNAAGDREVGARAASSARRTAARDPRATTNGASMRHRPTVDATARTPRRRPRPRARRSNSSSGPISVTSSVAASRALPTSAFASRCENGSIGPATGTPLRLIAPAAEVLDGRQQPGPDRRDTAGHRSRHERVELDASIGRTGPRRRLEQERLGRGRDRTA